VAHYLAEIANPEASWRAGARLRRYPVHHAEATPRLHGLAAVWGGEYALRMIRTTVAVPLKRSVGPQSSRSASGVIRATRNNFCAKWGGGE